MVKLTAVRFAQQDTNEQEAHSTLHSVKMIEIEISEIAKYGINQMCTVIDQCTCAKFMFNIHDAAHIYVCAGYMHKSTDWLHSLNIALQSNSGDWKALVNSDIQSINVNYGICLTFWSSDPPKALHYSDLLTLFYCSIC